jgi:hypothetical protein
VHIIVNIAIIILIMILKMMQSTLILIFILPRLLWSQTYHNSISGYVTDSETNQTLENVNVYISNTTFGASTDRDGFYIIKSIPPGNHELIVSIIGYDYASELITIKMDSKVKYDFKLNPHIFETSATEVLADIPHEWLKNLAEFKKYFLGQNDFAEHCEIENEEILEFSWTNKTILSASSKSPLMIRNDALGYQISCILASFSVDTRFQKWEWSVKPKFMKLNSTDNDSLNIWEENRKMAFEGSLHHFLLSLSQKNLENDSFVAYLVQTPGQRSARNESVGISEPLEDLFYYGDIPGQIILNFKDCLCIAHNLKNISWLQLRLDEIIIDQFGYPQVPNSFIVYGDWATRGFAASLPFYFVPKIED